MTEHTVTKADIRQRIWKYLEENNLANFPRPVYDRIRNFKGAAEAAHRLAGLQIFRSSRVFKVNPDKPQEEVRFLILQNDRNTLLVPTPRLRHGLFNRIVVPRGAGKELIRRCATSEGTKNFSQAVGLDSQIHVDMIVIGSVAVSPTGLRIGKGEGFADLECAMMKTMGAINEETIVVSTVHDCQVVDIPEHLYAPHDVCVDFIVTPSNVIEVQPRRPKPPGVLWSYLTTEKFHQVPILKVLRQREAARGVDVRLNDEPEGGSPEKPNASRAASSAGDRRRRERDVDRYGGDVGAPRPSLLVTDIPMGTRVSVFKAAVRARQANPIQVNWDGRQNRSFLDFKSVDEMHDALRKLEGLKIDDQELVVDISPRTKNHLKL